jgi:hypothetical protein
MEKVQITIKERIILSTLAPYSSLKTDDDARKLS